MEIIMSEKKIYSILVAEDNTLNQKLITTILSKQGFNFKLVENGEGAWESFQQEHFDLVLMDCQMHSRINQNSHYRYYSQWSHRIS